MNNKYQPINAPVFSVRDHGLTLPPRRIRSGSRFPFEKLVEVGDFFEVRDVEVLQNSIRTAAAHWGKKLKRHFTVRHHPDLQVYRVWRDA